MPGFLDKLTGGGVQWTLALQSPVVRPGDAIVGAVSFIPERDIDARGLIVSLVGTERYRYTERTNRSGSMSSNSREDTNDIVRQDVPLDGPNRYPARQPVQRNFQLAVPPMAPPTFESSNLGVKWRLEVRLDTGGRDPSTEQPVIILEPAGRVASQRAGLPVAPRFDGTDDGRPYAVWLDPAPLILGAPFSGAIDLTQPLEGGDVRVELKVDVEAGSGFGTVGSLTSAIILGSGDSNSHESVVVWRGPVSPGVGAAGWYRYVFQGTLPQTPVPTLDVPHGKAHATFALVVPRRMRPDVRYAREIALATGP
jgi:hypothetical protein